MVFWNPKKRRTTAKPKTTASISKPKVGSVKQELNCCCCCERERIYNY